jgi:hypothetical protein
MSDYVHFYDYKTFDDDDEMDECLENFTKSFRSYSTNIVPSMLDELKDLSTLATSPKLRVPKKKESTSTSDSEKPKRKTKKRSFKKKRAPNYVTRQMSTPFQPLQKIREEPMDAIDEFFLFDQAE